MPDQRDQSEFNMAVSFLNRLNGLFYVCDDASMSMNINDWFQSLVVIFRELSTEMKEAEITIKNNDIKLIFGKVNRHIDQSNKRGQMGISKELYWDLHEFELFLRKILKDSGLQQKMKDSAFDALR